MFKVPKALEESVVLKESKVLKAPKERRVSKAPKARRVILVSKVLRVSKVNLVEFPCDAALGDRLERAARTLDGVRVHRGVIATGDQFINRGDVRRRIHDLFGAKAVEMEGAAVAHACYVHGVPCGVLRSISDQANGQSDMDYPTFVRLAAAHSQQVVQRLLEDEA